MALINSFMGKYRFLSNFHLDTVEYLGFDFPASENAYQWAKDGTLETLEAFQKASPAQSKKLGREVTMRPDWDIVKDSVMLEILNNKFFNHKLRQMLLDTAWDTLVEGNTWHDNYWGDCYCARCRDNPGLNKLGTMLMDIRSNITFEV